MGSLSDEVMSGFKLAKVFTDCTGHISSLDFSHDGDHCLVGCTEDESIHLYDTIAAKYDRMASDSVHFKTLCIFIEVKRLFSVGSMELEQSALPIVPTM